MIDDLLNGENLFLSKEQINDIKNIKIENETFRTVAKIACTILNEKPNRKCKKIDKNSHFNRRHTDPIPG